MRALVLAACLTFTAAPLAASEAQADALWSLMRFDEYSAVLADEGAGYGKELADTLFPDEAGGEWSAAVARIYDLTALRDALRTEFHAQLDANEMDKAVAFYQGRTGSRSIELELTARRALLDPQIEDASIETMNRMRDEGDPRLDLIEAFSDVNGLVENNVVSAMNGNYAFLSALAEAGQGPYAEDPEGLLGAVWEQETEIRADTEQWVMSFFTFAYAPLSDDEVRSLIEFSGTEQGHRLNRALFAAFDALFDRLSAELGTAAAGFMEGKRL